MTIGKFLDTGIKIYVSIYDNFSKRVICASESDTLPEKFRKLRIIDFDYNGIVGTFYVDLINEFVYKDLIKFYDDLGILKEIRKGD